MNRKDDNNKVRVNDNSKSITKSKMITLTSKRKVYE